MPILKLFVKILYIIEYSYRKEEIKIVFKNYLIKENPALNSLYMPFSEYTTLNQ